MTRFRKHLAPQETRVAKHSEVFNADRSGNNLGERSRRDRGVERGLRCCDNPWCGRYLAAET